MSAQPSSAHLEALDLMESQAQNTIESEIKRMVERQDPFLHEASKNYEHTMIEGIT